MAKLQKVDMGDNCSHMYLVALVVGHNKMIVVLVHIAGQQHSRRRELAPIGSLQQLNSLIAKMTDAVREVLMQRKNPEELAIYEKDRMR